MKKVLITGANSYIGTNFEAYVARHYADRISTDTVDMVDGSWRQKDFSSYDIVFHVAGLAHSEISRVSESVKAKYYKINTELAVETCEKAKADGVGQFVFMSSAIIYGDSSLDGAKKRITRESEPAPTNFYGDSKWQADKRVRECATDRFLVTVLRPPMIYGKHSKGNYAVLAKLAKRLPAFPDIDNERSMLYIENLCEFLAQVMVRGEGGIFWPQNAEYSKTSDMVRMIGEATGHSVKLRRGLNWIVAIAFLMPGKAGIMARRAFGNLSYDQSISTYDFEYQMVDLATSIKRTEA